MTDDQAQCVRRVSLFGQQGRITADMNTYPIPQECIELGFLEETGEKGWFGFGPCPIARITPAGIDALREYDLKNLLEAQDAA